MSGEPKASDTPPDSFFWEWGGIPFNREGCFGVNYIVVNLT